MKDLNRFLNLITEKSLEKAVEAKVRLSTIDNSVKIANKNSKDDIDELFYKTEAKINNIISELKLVSQKTLA